MMKHLHQEYQPDFFEHSISFILGIVLLIPFFWFQERNIIETIMFALLHYLIYSVEIFLIKKNKTVKEEDYL